MTLQRFFLLTLLFCASAIGLAQAQGSAPPVEVTPAMEKVELSASGYLLEDPSHKLTIDDVRQPNHAKTFVRGATYSSSNAVTIWMRFTLRNGDDALVTWWLDTGNRVSQEVDVYVADARGATKHLSASSNKSFAERIIPTANFVFPVDLPPKHAVDIFLRVSTTTPLLARVEPVLWRPASFLQQARAETLQWFTYAGVCMALGLLNVMLWIFLRDAQYGAYVASLVGTFGVISFTGGGYGAANEFMTPNSPVVYQVLLPLSWIVGIVANCLFVVRLLSIKQAMPRLFRLLGVLLMLSSLGIGLRALAIALAIPGLTAFAVASNPLVVVLPSLVALCVVLALALALHKRLPLAGYAAVALLPYLAYGAWTTIAGNLLGIVTPPSFLMWGSMFEMLVMSLALADRFHREQQQKMLALAERERLSRLRRFFSPAVADKLVSDQAEDFMKPRRREIVVVFLDLRGYTAFTDTHEADEVMRVLGEFHEAMGEIIMAHGGTLERFAGDGLMIFFNDPIEIPDPAQQAVAMSVAMQKRFAELQTLWQSRGYTLAMGIGIAQGVATLGAIGFEGRRDYGAIGGVTNLAARLCGEAKGGQILVSEAVKNSMQISALRAIGKLALKGFAQEQEAYEWTQEGVAP